MKIHGMLFREEMVRAILAGTKNQTRRLIKPQPSPDFVPTVGLYHPTIIRRYGSETPGLETFGAYDEECSFPCLYPPGSVLYVKEQHWAYGRWVANGETKSGVPKARFVGYAESSHVAFGESDLMRVSPQMSGKGWHKRNSLFLPKRFARIWLRVTAVKCERLQSISDEDARSEGCNLDDLTVRHHRDAYRKLWDSINTEPGTRWENSPWVFAYTFERIERPKDL